jgi:hypothetical protein
MVQLNFGCCSSVHSIVWSRFVQLRRLSTKKFEDDFLTLRVVRFLAGVDRDDRNPSAALTICYK